MQTWLALPDGQEEVDPAFDHVPGGDAAAGRGRAAFGARADGRRCGASAAATPQHSPTIYADIELARGGSDPDRRRGRRAGADAGRRRGGARRPAARAVRAVRADARAMRRGCRARSAARAMLMGGGAFATPRHVFWNFVSSSRDRINQAKERLAGDALRR